MFATARKLFFDKCRMICLPICSRIKFEVLTDWMNTSQRQFGFNGSAGEISRSDGDIWAGTAESSSSNNNIILDGHLTTVASVLPVSGVFLLEATWWLPDSSSLD